MKLFAALIAVAAWSAASGWQPVFAQVAPNPTEIAQYTGLQAAAHQGDVARLQSLASAAGAALETRDGRGRTAIHIAAFARQRAAIRILAKAGAKIELLDNDRYDAVTSRIVAGNLSRYLSRLRRSVCALRRKRQQPALGK